MAKDNTRSVHLVRETRYLWRTVLLLLPIVMLVATSYFVRHTDADYWWHVRTGQLIVETGTLPRSDPFSYTAAGQPWVTHEWLTQVVAYLIQNYLGYWANAALWGLLGILTLLAVYAACRVRGLGEVGATLFSLLALMVGFVSANVRPQMISVLFLAITYLGLTRARTRINHGQFSTLGANKETVPFSATASNASAPRCSKGLWFLPILMILWVNLHGGYVIGLVLIWLTVAGEGFALLTGQRAIPFRSLLWVALLSSAAVLLSPNGLDAVAYPFTYAGSGNASMRFIQEWQSPDFHMSSAWALAGVLLLTTVVGLGGKPLGPSEVLWALSFGFLALTSLRHVPLYGVVVVPLLGVRLANWLPILRRPLAAWRRLTLLLAIWVGVPIILLLVIARMQPDKLDLQVHREPSSATFPVEGVAFLSSSNLEGNVFNEYGWGGYLIYHLYPQRLVFIDGRADVYGDEHVESYSRVAWVQPGWKQVLDQHQVILAILRKDSPEAALLESSGEWEELFVGQVEVVLVRRNLD